MTTINEFIANLRDLGVADSAIRGACKKKGFAEDEIESAIPKAPKKTFREDYYDYLVENLPTREEAKTWIESYDGYANSNIERNLSAFLRDVDLVARVAAAVR